jgi:hypothetical protein
VFLLISMLIVLLATSLRAYHIAQRSLWLDEALAANISRGTLSQMLTLTRGFHSAPIVDPLILYSVERVSTEPLAVRMPSLVASVLAVLLMLCFVTIPSIDYKTAGLAALMLGVSAAQIRYAQEVREYSLSVLYAGVLLYVFLSYISKKEEKDSPFGLYLALFLAPLVQYGLVLLCFGVLSALVVLALAEGRPGRQILQIVAAAGFLGLGGTLSLFLTVRYQWGDDAWYLKDYFWTPGSNIFQFIQYNTHHLITYLLPGAAVGALSALAMIVYLIESIRRRILPPLVVLACTSCGTVLTCSLMHFYPYGGIRQCLFLAPVLCLLASVSLVKVVDRFGGSARLFVMVVIVCVVVVSSAFQMRLQKPYSEIEDIQRVLSTLRSRLQPSDSVYIYPGAVFAVDFYDKERDPRFIYGDYHQKAQERHVPEMLAGLAPGSNRLWLVFSHIYRDEDQRIIRDLSQTWNVEPVLSATGSALYLATPRPTAIGATSAKAGNGVMETSRTVSIVDHTHDSFWDWNVRNSRYPAP